MSILCGVGARVGGCRSPAGRTRGEHRHAPFRRVTPVRDAAFVIATSPRHTPRSAHRMYAIASLSEVVKSVDRLRARSVLGRVPRNVWFLGLTSLVTDVSSEMVSSVLPVYLVLTIG